MDPLLSTLCTICHIDPPKYTCPRCSTETCSLACSKRHKIWSSCNGVRDPTVFMPMSKLATPSGIDHDYNFLHSIEHKISRSEKVLIEDLGLVSQVELERARTGETEEEWRRRTKKYAHELPGEVSMERALKDNGIKVVKAPKGMRRNKENTSNWNKKHKTIHWQIEWLRQDHDRALYKGMGSENIGRVYDAFCEEERKIGLSEKERALEKKRKSAHFKERRAKRPRLDADTPLTAFTLLQDPQTGAWNSTPEDWALETLEQSAPEPKHRDYYFYLHRPLTPASFPKVLAPIDSTKGLTDLLKGRDVLEFPTIHVLRQRPNELPDQFMLEKDYLAAIGQSEVEDTDTEMSSASEEDRDESSSSSSDSSDSSSEQDTNEEMEDVEIV